MNQGAPRRTGIGLRTPHLPEVLATRPALGWLEVHPENYLCGGQLRRSLFALRDHYPISLHAVGLSLGSADGLDDAHLGRIAELARELDPIKVSEHLSFSTVQGRFTNDLLPLPYTEEALDLVSAHIQLVQEHLRRSILIENPSQYLRWQHSTIAEPEFLSELVRSTGCGLLCDVNNVFVTCSNFGLDPLVWLRGIPAAAIGEMHLAGHQAETIEDQTVLIDTHGAPVSDPVWALFEDALQLSPNAPVLIERDRNIPALDQLVAEAQRADRIADGVRRRHEHDWAA
jgi:uncharacterized protein (UPF0276 family)